MIYKLANKKNAKKQHVFAFLGEKCGLQQEFYRLISRKTAFSPLIAQNQHGQFLHRLLSFSTVFFRLFIEFQFDQR